MKNYLQKNDFKNPKIYFVSSLAAFLPLKVINNNDLTRKEKRDYQRLSLLLDKKLANYNVNITNKKNSKQLEILYGA